MVTLQSSSSHSDAAVTAVQLPKMSTSSSWPCHKLHNPRVTVPGTGSDAALCSGTRQQGGCVPTWGLNHKHDTLLPTNHWTTFMCHPNKMSPTFILPVYALVAVKVDFTQHFAGGVRRCGCGFVVEFWLQKLRKCLAPRTNLLRFSWTCTVTVLDWTACVYNTSLHRQMQGISAPEFRSGFILQFVIFHCLFMI